MAEWFEEGLDQEHLDHAKAKGWDKPLTADVARAMIHAHRAAEKHMGGMVRMPTDATDPSYRGLYERVVGMSSPKSAEEYKLDDVRFKDGNPLDAADQKFVAELAFAYKLPPAAARALAVGLADRAEAMEAEEATAADLARQVNNAALRQAWGAEYDQKDFTASRAVDAFPQAVRDAIDLLPTPAYVQMMTALLGYGQAMNEAAMLRGGRAAPDPTAGMTAEQAQERLGALQNDPKWRADAFTRGTEAHRVWEQLTSVIARARARV